MSRLFLSRQFIAFVVTGGIAALINFGSRILYNQWVGYSAAIVLAYITGMITAFLLARAFVFRDSVQTLHKSALFFGLVNLAAVAQTWVVSVTLAHYVLPAIGVSDYVQEVAHAFGVSVPVLTSFIGHKKWSFRA